MCVTAEQLARSESPEEEGVKAIVKFAYQNEDGEEVAAPVDFMQCADRDFPLIVTYSAFLRMLDRSLPQSFFSLSSVQRTDEDNDEEDEEGAGADHYFDREVDFDRFDSHYFPRFSETIRTVGDSSLFFTEIMSHIKGSLVAMRTERGHLGREQYLQLGTQRQSTLSINQRNLIYDAFQRYEKLKAQEYTGDYDVLDVVAHVYRILSAHPEGYRGAAMYSVFVDEVQDLTPAQIALFRFVCGNPKGYVFAGDTAQTVILF
jgi:hypothetical protein